MVVLLALQDLVDGALGNNTIFYRQITKSHISEHFPNTGHEVGMLPCFHAISVAFANKAEGRTLCSRRCIEFLRQ